MQYATINLAVNVGRLTKVAQERFAGDDLAECNPGGSTICTTGTRGCDAGLTCVGTSSSLEECGFGSAVMDLGLNAHILVENEQLARLQEELKEVITKYAKG